MVPDPKLNFVEVPYFRSWNGDQRLRHHPLKRSAVPATYRGDLYTSAGIRPGEVNPKDPAKANLSDFKASVLLSGPIKIALTSDPSLHLRFNENEEMRPTLLILDSRTITMLALLDLTGFMT